MRKYLLRIENMLLSFPLSFLLLRNKFYTDGTIDVHLHDTYLVIDVYFFVGALLWFFLMPWFLHGILRWKQKRNVICSLHVILTLLLFGYLLSISLMDHQHKQADFVIKLLVTVQIVFLIYFWFVYWGSKKI